MVFWFLEVCDMADKGEHFDYYMKYSESLRNWLIVYGVGGIALLYKEGDTFCKDQVVRIALSLILAVFFQVLIAFVNKWDHWLADAEKTSNFYGKIKLPGRLLFVVNLGADLVSLGAFFFATCLLIGALRSAPQVCP